MNDPGKLSPQVPATAPPEIEEAVDGELSTEALETVAGGVSRTGPGTQTEDDIYVG